MKISRLTFAVWQVMLLLHVASVAYAAEGPYGGTPAPIPGTVMAENYDTGGAEVAYFVNSVNGTNNGYRSDGVNLETASAPATGNDLGWTSGGQWFRYTVNVATAGTYNVSFLVAGNTASSDAFHLSNSSGTNLTGSVAVPATGGWQTWTTVTATVTLPAGAQTLTLNQDNGGWNIDAMTFASASLPYNVNAIYTNGTSFSTGGADGNGYAFSATLLGATQTFNGTTFTYGPSNAVDAFKNVTIPVTAGSYSGLNVLGFAVNSNEASQTFTIHYSNGTTSTDTQSISDWCSPQGYSGETTVKTMSYRNTSSGGEDSSTCNVYGYALAVNSSLTLSSVTIPNNSSVIVLGVQPILQSLLPYNIYAIYTNGTSFSTGGADGGGNALSATVMGTSKTWNGTTFTFGPSNTPNAFSNQTIALTPGSFSSLNVLAFAVNGNQPSQKFQVNYTNGTYSTVTQSISDWASSQGYSGETKVVTLPYTNTSAGGENSGGGFVYGYTLPVTSSLTVKSITLPDNSSVIALGVQDQAPSGPIRRTASEVLVVYNSNSPTSQAIANYYEQERGVTNVVAVNCADSALNSTNETITLANYTSEIANPISNYLSGHSGINFIVLTKGIPIRISGGLTGSVGNGIAYPSVDSYLAAIDYSTIPTAMQANITGSVGWVNRYYNKSVPFTHAQFGGYLVTRLDGYTQADAEAVVTHAIAAEQNLGSGPVLLDGSPSYGIDDPSPPILAAPLTTVTGEESYDIWNTDLARAGDILQASGIPVDSVYTNTFVGNMTNLLGYYSWGSNDGNFNSAAYESLAFLPGAIGDTAVSTSARSLLTDNDGGQSLITDLIAHGITGVRGYVNEPLLDAISSPTIVYTHFMSGYSLAESFYAGSRYIGWEDINIGDPLCTPYWGKYTIVLPTTFNTPPLQ